MTSAEERARELWHKLSAQNAVDPEQELAAFIHKTERDKANETWEAALEIVDGHDAPIARQMIRSRIIEGKP